MEDCRGQWKARRGERDRESGLKWKSKRNGEGGEVRRVRFAK